MTNIKIRKGFEELKKDCRRVYFIRYANKSEIPTTAIYETTNGEFNHRYINVRKDSFDDCDFWGYIYLPYIDDIYMKFEVYA